MVFGRFPTGALERLIAEQTIPVTVTPPSDGGSPDPSYDTAEMDESSEYQTDLLLYDSQDRPSFAPDGVVRQSSVEGLCLDGDEPAKGARIDFADARYELMETRDIPRTGTPVAQHCTFDPVATE